MTTLREGTVDAEVWNGRMAIEYPWLKELVPEEVVLDLGAHIGAFSVYAHAAGSRRIFAFEASAANYQIAVGNLADLDGIRLIRAAIVRSDARSIEAVRLGAFPIDGGTINTGGASLMYGDGYENVPTTTLDSVIDNALVFSGRPAVRTMKIDIEGSEWPVLYTCTKIGLIHEIFGEYHYLPADVEKTLDLAYPCDTLGLRVWLIENGFSIDVISEPRAYQRPGGCPIGYFRAIRGEVR